MTRLILGLLIGFPAGGGLGPRFIPFSSSFVLTSELELLAEAELVPSANSSLLARRREVTEAATVSWGFRYQDKSWAAFWPGSRSRLPIATGRLPGGAVSHSFSYSFSFRQLRSQLRFVTGISANFSAFCNFKPFVEPTIIPRALRVCRGSGH